MSIKHLNIELMVVDPLTKGLLPKTFKEHVKRVLIVTFDAYYVLD